MLHFYRRERKKFVNMCLSKSIFVYPVRFRVSPVGAVDAPLSIPISFLEEPVLLLALYGLLELA